MCWICLSYEILYNNKLFHEQTFSYLFLNMIRHHSSIFRSKRSSLPNGWVCGGVGWYSDWIFGQTLSNNNPSFFEYHNCHSLVLIIILIPIKTRIDNIFGKNTTPPQTQQCLILPKLLTFQVTHTNKSCLSTLEQSKMMLDWVGANVSAIQQPHNLQRRKIKSAA